VERLLDLGGGSGAYSIAFARALPELRAEILDRPGVVPIARRHIEEAGLGERVKVRVGDLRDDRYGSDYDLLFMSAICHMNSPEENLAMFRKAFEALSPSGRVVIQDFILNADKTGPRTGALFALNMLVGTRAGSSYSIEEYGDWLRSVGFQEVQQIRLPGPTDLLVAQRS
jgi:predicted O-methyltransferase YrrM